MDLYTVKNSIYFWLLFSFSSFSLKAYETQNKFDSLYLDIATRLKATDLDEGVRKADSLFINSVNPTHKIKTSLLLAMLYEYKAQLADAIYWASESQKLAIAENNHEYQVRSSGYLATLYRFIDLGTESNIHLEIAEKANAQRKLDPNYHAVQSVIYHEMAANLIGHGKYDEAIAQLEKSIASLNKVNNPTGLHNFSYVSILDTYVEAYIYKKDYIKAREKAEEAIKIEIKNYPELVSTLYSSLGVIEMKEDNYEKAFEYLNIARESSEVIPNLLVQIKVLKALVLYYKQTGDIENSLFYSDKLTETNRKRTESIEKVTNELLTKMHNSNNKSNFQIYYLIVTVVTLILIAIGIIYFYKFKLKKQHVKYKTLVDSLKNNQKHIENSQKIEIATIKEQPDEHNLMTPETQTRLIEQLNLLEEKKFFLNKEISLSSLTVELNSNTRYVSYIIKTYKNNDFKNYINELRILYTINLLREEPQYLKYKISYIADIAGFSSHSKFASIFKKVTNLTPSSFIQEVKDENKRKSKQSYAE